jgi:N-carbamoylputrescine amidase
MKVTVCELGNNPEIFARDWERLAAHAAAENSEMILLPEMPFSPWFAWSPEFDPAIWENAVKAHREATSLLEKLSPAFVCGSLPINNQGKRHNEAFVWDSESGYRYAHTKYYLPDEEGYWEAS